MKWLVWDLLRDLETTAKKMPGYFRKAFIASCTALVGLVASDNLLGFTKLPISNAVAAVVVVIVTAVGILSVNRSWGLSWRKLVMNTIYWMFGAMGLIVLGISRGETT